jgi:hypothetical protein
MASDASWSLNQQLRNIALALLVETDIFRGPLRGGGGPNGLMLIFWACCMLPIRFFTPGDRL